VGCVAGALIGTLAVGAGVPLWSELSVIGLVGLVALGFLSGPLIDDSVRSSRAGIDAPLAMRARLSTVVLVLAGVALISMLCEGAVADWSANYLRNELHASARWSGLGFVWFTLAMAGVRFAGSALLTRHAARSVLPLLAVVSAAGMAVGFSTACPVVALAGFAALGVGVGLVVPTVFSMAGDCDGSAAGAASAGAAVATVSALGWLGFVVGPPVIGYLADVIGLTSALWILPASMLVIAVVVRRHPVFREGHRARQATEA
jgi:fucose permease